MVKFIARWLWLSWCWIELSVLTLVCYALSWLPRKFTGRYYHALSRMWCRFFIRALGIDLRLHQQNQYDLPEQFILIANHPSALEDFAIPSLFDVYPLGKEGVRHWYVIGRMAESANTIFVKRSDPESRHAALESLHEAVAEGRNIALFPEGGCMGRRIYERFHAGAFELAMRTGIPILPVFIHYEAQDTFEWHAPHTLLHKFWHFLTAPNNRANYYVFDAIDPSVYTDKIKFAEDVRQQYLRWQNKYLE